MRALGRRLLFSLSAVVAVACAGAGAARAGGYVFTPIDGDPTGINDSDTVVGTDHAQGFVWRAGTKTFFGAPKGATFVRAGHINRHGIALAYDTLADGTAGSFTYNTNTGVARQLMVAGATNTYASSIADGGNLAGCVTLPGSDTAHSFAIVDGVTTTFDPPGAVFSCAAFVGADGTVGGAFSVGDPMITSGYVYKGGVFTIINPPFAKPFEGIDEVSVDYVGPHGVVSGNYDYGISRAGFTYKDGVYSSPFYDIQSLRILKDGTYFGVSFGTNDHVYAFGPHAHGYLFPPGDFTNVAYDVNENGDFVGYITTLTQNYQTIVATCPVGQAPCY